MNNRILLNLGCGPNRPKGWINTDSSLNSLIQKVPFFGNILPKYLKTTVYSSASADYMDLNKPWKFTSGSVDVVYASHVFEHLTLVAADLFMMEAYRVLKPNGVLRIVVPDFYKLSKKYIADYEQGQEQASQDFLYALNLHKEGIYPSDLNLIAKLLNWLQDYPHQHKYMYDASSLKKSMLKAGFIDIKDSSYAESKCIPEIKQVEFTAEGILSIYLEAKKSLV